MPFCQSRSALKGEQMWSEMILKTHYTARVLQSGLSIRENQDLHHKDKWNRDLHRKDGPAKRTISSPQNSRSNSSRDESLQWPPVWSLQSQLQSPQQEGKTNPKLKTHLTWGRLLPKGWSTATAAHLFMLDEIFPNESSLSLEDTFFF